MKIEPLVTITLLTYNHEHYIEDCLQSIIDQDYKNIELLILDDASKDMTPKVVESYLSVLEEKYKKVCFIKNKRNTGNIPFNMNCMLKKAEGTYCKMLSGDDILDYNCISKLVESLENHPDCSVAYSNVYIVQDDYKRGDWIDKTNSLFAHRKTEVESQNFFVKLMYGNRIPAASAMIKSGLLREYGWLDESIAYEDYEYWLRLSFHNVKFYFINENLAYYRKSDTSISNFMSGDKARKIRIGMVSDRKACNKYMRYLKEEDKIKCKKFYYYRYLRTCYKGKYWRGVAVIVIKLKQENIEIPWEVFKNPTIDEWQETRKRDKMLIQMLEKWISNVQSDRYVVNYFRNRGYKTIGIYGLGCIASRLCEELKETEIEIKYIIDRNADVLLSDIKLVTLNDELEKVDAIVVVPAGQYQVIRRQLEEKVVCPIVYIGDVLFGT